jgi:kynurenine formamidase
MNTSQQIIDLTRVIKDKQPGVTIAQTKTKQKDGWNAKTISSYSHSGTHMDAPWHFESLEVTIDEIPVERFVGKAWVVDVEVHKPSQLISLDDIVPQLSQWKPGDSMIIRTGWSDTFDSNEYRDELPRIGVDLAHWMVRNKVNMLGVEPPSVADVNNLEEVTLIHEILLKAGIIIIEGLVNLEYITTEFCQLIALPLKIFEGDGAPARVVAVIKSAHE